MSKYKEETEDQTKRGEYIEDEVPPEIGAFALESTLGYPEQMFLNLH
jgi:hypothetical protein